MTKFQHKFINGTFTLISTNDDGTGTFVDDASIYGFEQVFSLTNMYEV